MRVLPVAARESNDTILSSQRSFLDARLRSRGGRKECCLQAGKPFPCCLLTTFSIPAYNVGMKQTILLKLKPTEEQIQALLDTMHAFNAACNYVASVAFAEKMALPS